MDNVTITELLALLGAIAAGVTAMQHIALQLEKVAAKTQSAQDDKIMARVVSVLSFASGLLDRFSIGSTPRKGS